MKFHPFSKIPQHYQERIALAPRPRVHVEPLVLTDEKTKHCMPAIHLQIGNEHALMLMEDLEELELALRGAVLKLEDAARASR